MDSKTIDANMIAKITEINPDIDLGEWFALTPTQIVGIILDNSINFKLGYLNSIGACFFPSDTRFPDTVAEINRVIGIFDEFKETMLCRIDAVRHILDLKDGSRLHTELTEHARDDVRLFAMANREQLVSKDIDDGIIFDEWFIKSKAYKNKYKNIWAGEEQIGDYI